LDDGYFSIKLYKIPKRGREGRRERERERVGVKKTMILNVGIK
jgi:hypothetical protein